MLGMNKISTHWENNAPRLMTCSLELEACLSLIFFFFDIWANPLKQTSMILGSIPEGKNVETHQAILRSINLKKNQA